MIIVQNLSLEVFVLFALSFFRVGFAKSMEHSAGSMHFNFAWENILFLLFLVIRFRGREASLMHIVV